MDSSNSSNNNQEFEGNTNLKLSSKKQDSAAVAWCFTWNNYPNVGSLSSCEVFSSKSSEISRLVAGREVGENGTPHLQGYVEFIKKKRFTELKKLFPDGIHWEKKSKKSSKMQAIQYCWKEDKEPFVMNIRPPAKSLAYDDLYPFQKMIVDMCKSVPDDRTINWYYETKGNVGKSALVKYLCLNCGALVCAGKAADMKFLIVKYLNKHGSAPPIIIMDIPRTSLDYLSYAGMEEIKNGCFASTKYECEMAIFDSPHVLCFANEPPRIDNMSKDRWNIVNLDSKTVPDTPPNSPINEGHSVFDY